MSLHSSTGETYPLAYVYSYVYLDQTHMDAWNFEESKTDEDVQELTSGEMQPEITVQRPIH